MDLIQSHGCLDYEGTIKSLKAFRASATVANQSLVYLAIECIHNNAKLFNHNAKSNPLCNLPNTLVQKFLRHTAPVELELVICMLSSGAVTEFDFSKWSREDRKVIYKTLVSKCSRVRKITMPALWLEKKRLYSGAEEMDSQWTKWVELREADFRGHCFTDAVLQSALISCPKLEKLCFSIDSFHLNTKCANCLINMGSLRELQLDINNFNEDLKKSASLLVLIVERSPNLSKLNSCLFEDPDFCYHFLLALSKIKQKYLIIVQLTISHFPNLCWPELIRTNKLILIGPINEKFVAKICNNFDVEHVQVVEFDGVLPSSMYPVIEAFGPSLRHLVIKSCEHSLDRRETQTLNLYRVFASAGKLETFEFALPLRLEANPRCGVGVKHFQSMTDFKVEILSWDGSQSAMKKIYKLYLLGSKKCRILSIQTKELLETSLKTLKRHPDIGQRFEEIHLDIYRMDMLVNAIQITTLLALRSPVLRLVVLRNSVSRECSITEELDNNHQWFKQFLLEINVCLQISYATIQFEETSSASD